MYIQNINTHEKFITVVKKVKSLVLRFFFELYTEFLTARDICLKNVSSQNVFMLTFLY